MAVEQVDAGEHHDPEDRQREQVEQRLRDHRAEHDRQRLPRAAETARDDQRARGLTQARRERGGHQDADERALHRVAAFGLAPGRGGREDRVPGDRPGKHRGAHQREAGGEQAGAGGEQARGDAADADVHEREQREREAAERGCHQRARGAARAWSADAARAILRPDPAEDVLAGRGLQARQTLGGNTRQQIGGNQAEAHPDTGGPRRGTPDGQRLLVAVEHLGGDVRPGKALGAHARGGGHAACGRRGRARASAAPRPARARRRGASARPSIPSRTTSR